MLTSEEVILKNDLAFGYCPEMDGGFHKQRKSQMNQLA